MIVLDASVLIAHLGADDGHAERATALLSSLVDEEFAASPLTLAEVFVGPARKNKVTQAQAALRDLGVRTVSLPAEAPLRLALLRATTGLRLADCCVLHAAETTDGALATFDDRLAQAATDLGYRVHH